MRPGRADHGAVPILFGGLLEEKRKESCAWRALKSVFAREREMKIEPFFQPIYLDVKRKALVSTVCGTQYRGQGCNKLYY